MNDFDKLVSDAQDLLKAMTTAEPGEGEGGGEGEGDEAAKAAAAAAAAAAAKKSKGTLAKSLTVEIDGEVVEAFDGAELVKALLDQTTTLNKQGTATMTVLAGSMKLLKSLHDDTAKLKASVAALETQGRGRKSATVVAAGDPGAGKGSELDREVTKEEFLNKAEQLYKDRKISALDLNMAETYLNRGMAPPEKLSKAILGELGVKITALQ